MQDATVQSIPQTSPSVAPSQYAAPAPQQAPQGPINYQVGTQYPQAVPAPAQAVTSYQSSPTQYAPQSQPESNSPWESAFNRVVGLLSSPVQSPFQAAPSAPTTYSPANYGTSNPGTPSWATQTSQANPTFSPSSSQTSSPEHLAQVADSLNLSPESRQVVEAYGVEAPAVLNQYALQLEGMVDSALAWGQKANEVLTKWASFGVNEHVESTAKSMLLNRYAQFAVNEHSENLAYNEILTNPDTLSDYTLKFFGPEGPCPVYENEGELETPGYRTAPVNTGATAQFPAPPAAAQTAPQQPQNFWNSFSEQMTRDPQQAWKILNQAQPNTVANKLFVME